MLNNTSLLAAAQQIRQGGIIAYPTESVYGLGCDPFNQLAVQKLLRLKQRDITKGFIVIAANWQQVQRLTQPISAAKLAKIIRSWSKPITWVFPASEMVPVWIRGDFTSVALRITSHPVAKSLCELTGPLVSTSANLHQQPSAKTATDVVKIFADQIDVIIDARTGDLTQPTPIINALDDQIFRE